MRYKQSLINLKTKLALAYHWEADVIEKQEEEFLKALEKGLTSNEIEQVKKELTSYENSLNPSTPKHLMLHGIHLSFHFECSEERTDFYNGFYHHEVQLTPKFTLSYKHNLGYATSFKPDTKKGQFILDTIHSIIERIGLDDIMKVLYKVFVKVGEVEKCSLVTRLGVTTVTGSFKGIRDIFSSPLELSEEILHTLNTIPVYTTPYIPEELYLCSIQRYVEHLELRLDKMLGEIFSDGCIFYAKLNSHFYDILKPLLYHESLTGQNYPYQSGNVKVQLTLYYETNENLTTKKLHEELVPKSEYIAKNISTDVFMYGGIVSDVDVQTFDLYADHLCSIAFNMDVSEGIGHYIHQFSDEAYEMETYKKKIPMMIMHKGEDLSELNLSEFTDQEFKDDSNIQLIII